MRNVLSNHLSTVFNYLPSIQPGNCKQSPQRIVQGVKISQKKEIKNRNQQSHLFEVRIQDNQYKQYQDSTLREANNLNLLVAMNSPTKPKTQKRDNSIPPVKSFQRLKYSKINSIKNLKKDKESKKKQKYMNFTKTQSKDSIRSFIKYRTLKYIKQLERSKDSTEKMLKVSSDFENSTRRVILKKKIDYFEGVTTPESENARLKAALVKFKAEKEKRQERSLSRGKMPLILKYSLAKGFKKKRRTYGKGNDKLQKSNQSIMNESNDKSFYRLQSYQQQKSQQHSYHQSQERKRPIQSRKSSLKQGYHFDSMSSSYQLMNRRSRRTSSKSLSQFILQDQRLNKRRRLKSKKLEKKNEKPKKKKKKILNLVKVDTHI